MQEVRLTLAAAFLMALCLAAPALADTLTLGEVNVEQPRITIYYTKDVRLDIDNSLLRNTDADTEYRLTLQGDPSAYASSFTLNTGENLTAGPHILVITAQDKRTGLSRTDTVSFTVSGTSIVLTEPRFGVAAQRPYTARLETRHAGGQPAQARCSYSLIGWDAPMAAISSSPQSEHIITGLSHRGSLYVACEELSGRTTRRKIPVSWDNTPPVLRVTATPNPVTNPDSKSAFLAIQADENVSCVVDNSSLGDPGDPSSYRSVHELQRFYNDITDTAQHVITHTVACTNLAGLTNRTDAGVTVNFGLIAAIDVISPQQITNHSSFTLSVRPTFAATQCVSNNASMQRSGDTFSQLYSGIREGSVLFSLSCTGPRTASRMYNVTVDLTPPVMLDLNTTDTVCDGSVEAVFRAADNGSGVLSYTYTVTAGNFSENATVARAGARVRIPRSVEEGEWSVYATDVAGNRGLPRTVGFTCSDEDVPDSRNETGGTCGNGVQDAGEDGIDCGGACAACATQCLDDLDCPLGETCGPEGACAAGAPAGGCVIDDDCAGGEVCDTFTSLCVPDSGAPDAACSTSFDCASGEECSAGLCVPVSSAPSSVCSADADCEEGTVCLDGLCVFIEEEGVSWLAIGLIAAGALLIAGAGYFLYQQHVLKGLRTPDIPPRAANTVAAPQAAPSPPPPASPAPRVDEVRRQSLREQQKALQRKAVFDSFGKDPDVPPAPKPSKPAKEKNSVFDELDDIGK